MTSNVLLAASAPPWVTTWLTPIWILSLGAALGLVGILIVWGVIRLISRPAADEAALAVREGVLFPVFWILVALSSLALVGPFFLDDCDDLLNSLVRLPVAGEIEYEVAVPAPSPDASLTNRPVYEFDVDLRLEELRSISFQSDREVAVSRRKSFDPYDPNVAVRTEGGAAPVTVTESDLREDPTVAAKGRIRRFYVQNLGAGPATLTIVADTAPQYRQIKYALITALSVLGLFGVYLAIRFLAPKLWAIALSTAKSEVSQPLYLICMGLGLFLLLLFMVIPYFTLGEDIKMLKDSGLTLIMVLSIILAVWAASSSISDEVEGKTALTLLSKPIGRRQFVIGKFVGIALAVALFFIVLSVFFIIVVAYKPIYDARETAGTQPTWPEAFNQVIHTIPGLVLAFMETLVMTSISVAISTRLPMIANFLICFTIYALGHLTPLVLESSIGNFEPVVFVGNLIATILPVLDHFNIQAAVAAGTHVPYQYLAEAAIYCILYCTAAMLLALVLFEDRDLA